MQYDAKFILANEANPILPYDGVCGLCDRLVQFVLRRDHRRLFRFAALQSSLAGKILERNGQYANALDTFYVVANPNMPAECLLSRSDAMAFVLMELGGIWRIVGLSWRLLPRRLRDAVYNLVAANRYQMVWQAFGMSHSQSRRKGQIPGRLEGRCNRLTQRI
jgi:predicted DCC family thiol-disulfide oxidoreductase YuxK